MVQLSESNKSFFGLLLYLSSHLFCIYYLLWILITTLIDHSHRHPNTTLNYLETQLVKMAAYFPDSKWRLVLPSIILGVFVVYSLISFGLMWSKRQEGRKIIREREKKGRKADLQQKESCVDKAKS